MKRSIKTIVYIVLQLTWGFLQTAAGAAVFLFLIGREHFVYKGCVATVWRNKSSASIGMFIFISDSLTGELREKIIMHEYGHTLQSIVLGPLYIPVISIPSMLWCMLPVFVRLRAGKNISYYRLYTESWANRLGGVELK